MYSRNLRTPPCPSLFVGLAHLMNLEATLSSALFISVEAGLIRTTIQGPILLPPWPRRAAAVASRGSFSFRVDPRGLRSILRIVRIAVRQR